MTKLVREFSFSPEQLHEVAELARAIGVTGTTAGILYARGLDTEEKARAFLAPSKKHFLSPFLMRGMKEAKELLEKARGEGWRVAVFGDYDADGIGACAILSRALTMFGIEPYVFVPERTDGYGLSVAAIDRIFDEFLPDLIVTVDCGISCKQEVEYIKEQGAYVIVTDHHELPDELPECIVVNPKLEDDYPYDNLCGAGVALKLAQALVGDRADGLVDFAALSTVADSVPLFGENRDIVAEGLRLMEKSLRPAFAALLGKTGEITAQTLAFTVAPRVNAAGRMGDAASALKLFLSEDEGEIEELGARLNAYNLERQKRCDELYTQAHGEVLRQGAYGNVVMLASENWNAGFVGIVAARIAEEFARPALLFVRRGEMLRGSARSIESVNIFEALKSCSSYIEEFGGHAQAAGVNVSEDSFEDLRAALDGYIAAHYTREDFEKSIPVAGELSEDFRTVAHEITMLEPCGIGNRRPLFYVSAGSVNAAPIKPGSPHLTMNVGGFELVYFNGARDLGILESDVEKRIVFEYNVSRYRGKEYVKGFVRCVTYDGFTGKDIELEAFERRLGRMAKADTSKHMEEGDLNAFLKDRLEGCAYGLAAVLDDRASLARFPALNGMELDVFRPSSGSCANIVLFAPDEDCDLSVFRDVVFLDGAASPVGGHTNVVSNASVSDMGAMKRVSAVREDLLELFAALRRAEGAETGESYAEAARRLKLPFAPEQVVFALAVFEELGLISLKGGRLAVPRGRKADLKSSAVYRAVARIKEGGPWTRS